MARSCWVDGLVVIARACLPDGLNPDCVNTHYSCRFCGALWWLVEDLDPHNRGRYLHPWYPELEDKDWHLDDALPEYLGGKRCE